MDVNGGAAKKLKSELVAAEGKPIQQPVPLRSTPPVQVQPEIFSVTVLPSSKSLPTAAQLQIEPVEPPIKQPRFEGSVTIVILGYLNETGVEKVEPQNQPQAEPEPPPKRLQIAEQQPALLKPAEKQAETSKPAEQPESPQPVQSVAVQTPDESNSVQAISPAPKMVAKPITEQPAQIATVKDSPPLEREPSPRWENWYV